jgi:hypothetical protein
LTVEEIALRLRVKPGWVYRHAGALDGFRVGKYVRFYWPTVLDCLKQNAKRSFESAINSNASHTLKLQTKINFG